MNNEVTGTLMANIEELPPEGGDVAFDVVVGGHPAKVVLEEPFTVQTGDTVEISYRASVDGDGAVVALEDVKVVAVHPRPEPPPGWVPFGTHAQDFGGMVEGAPPPPSMVFSYDVDGGGMPLWERPGDLRQELGDMLARWHAAEADVETGVRDCIRDLETLLGLSS